MYKSFFLFILIFLSFSFNSQNLRIIDTTDYLVRKNLIENYEIQHELFYKNLKSDYKGELRKKITNLYEKTHQEFLKNIRTDKFIFDKRFTNYIDSLAQIIIKANPELSERQITIYLSKNPSINAFSAGDGIIILNIGLFKYFKNDAQLISVLSHEIAHEKLNHVANNILKEANLITSEKYKIQARKIIKERFNTYDKSFEILKNLMYSDSKVHRKKEMQADSVGYKLFKNTSINYATYTSALQLLAKYEKLKNIELDSTVYKIFFDIPKQPFQDSWIKMEEFSDYNYSHYKEKINKDSIETHPEYNERIAKLNKDFPELNIKDSINPETSNTFLLLQNLAQKEDIVSFYDMEEYGLSIKLILHKLYKNPDDIFLKKWLGVNFLRLYEAKKNYQLNRYVEQINPKEQSKKYQQFLNFIWNLNLNEIKNIGDYYSNF